MRHDHSETRKANELNHRSCFIHVFIQQWYLKPNANLTNYLLSENGNHLVRGLEECSTQPYVIGLAFVTILIVSVPAIAILPVISATILNNTPIQLLT